MTSQTQRAITELEFRTLHSVFRDASDSMLWRYGMHALITFQFHIIARINDTTTQVLMDHICVHDLFPNCFKTKLNGGEYAYQCKCCKFAMYVLVQ